MPREETLKVSNNEDVLLQLPRKHLIYFILFFPFWVPKA